MKSRFLKYFVSIFYVLKVRNSRNNNLVGGAGIYSADFLNFRQIFHWFTLNFANTPFQFLKVWNIVYKNMKTPNVTKLVIKKHCYISFVGVIWIITPLYTKKKNVSTYEEPQFCLLKERLNLSSSLAYWYFCNFRPDTSVKDVWHHI